MKRWRMVGLCGAVCSYGVCVKSICNVQKRTAKNDRREETLLNFLISFVEKVCLFAIKDHYIKIQEEKSQENNHNVNIHDAPKPYSDHCDD